MYPVIGTLLILSAPPAIIQSAIPACIFAVAMPIVSIPDEQKRFTVTPGTSTISKPINEMSRAIFSPCDPSGIAFPTITSSIRFGSSFGNSFIMCLMVSAANSSVLLKRNTPFGALPTAVRNALTIYACFIS